MTNNSIPVSNTSIQLLTFSPALRKSGSIQFSPLPSKKQTKWKCHTYSAWISLCPSSHIEKLSGTIPDIKQLQAWNCGVNLTLPSIQSECADMLSGATESAPWCTSCYGHCPCKSEMFFRTRSKQDRRETKWDTRATWKYEINQSSWVTSSALK